MGKTALLALFVFALHTAANAAITYAPINKIKTCGLDFNGVMGYSARVFVESETMSYNFPFNPSVDVEFEKAKSLLSLLLTAKSTGNTIELMLTDSWISGQKPFIGVQLNPN